MTQERKNPIIRREKFVVDHTEKNTYGDLIVASQSGNEYKIGVKRKHLFDYFQDGTEVVVGYASYMNREYIDEVTPSNQVVSTDTPIHNEKPVEISKKTISGEELGMWYKELGNRIGDGSIEKDYPKAHIKIKGQYYKRMSEVTGVDFKGKEG